MKLERHRIDTPVGPLCAAFDAEDRLWEIDFGAEPGVAPARGRAALELAEQLARYFAGESPEFTVALAERGTPFQRSVWDALRAIPPGETATYAGIARKIGRPSAVRAVGMANNKNPWPILVPCHRVIGSDGSLVGYAGGLDMKRKLLALEGAPAVATPLLGS